LSINLCKQVEYDFPGTLNTPLLAFAGGIKARTIRPRG